MKKIIARPVFSALCSVSVCVLFLGGIIPGLPLWAGIPCACVASLAASLLVENAFHPRREAPAAGDGPDGAVTDTEQAPPPPETAGKRGYEVYQRAVQYMEEAMPYLDDALNLEQFAKAIFSNKVYVSKNINYYSGRNFRQFVNWYRIRHAIGLMKKDPRIRMEDVSMRSGFHSSVSFNMAFCLFEGKTPTQWIEEYVDSLRKR